MTNQPAIIDTFDPDEIAVWTPGASALVNMDANVTDPIFFPESSDFPPDIPPPFQIEAPGPMDEVQWLVQYPDQAIPNEEEPTGKRVKLYVLHILDSIYTPLTPAVVIEEFLVLSKGTIDSDAKVWAGANSVGRRNGK